MSKVIFSCESDKLKRLDVLIHDYISELDGYDELTRSQIKNLIVNEKVFVNDKVIKKPGEKISKGSLVCVLVEKKDKYEIEPYEFELDILYQDNDVAVVNKPIGLTMHPGAGNSNKTLVNALYYNSVISSASIESFNSERPGIVHRLDKDTSGVVVVAKNLKALQHLSKQFSDRSIERKYKALAYVTPRASRVIQTNNSGLIDKPIGRHKTKPTLMQVDGKSPKIAKTNYKVIDKYSYAFLLELKLETGRTHQIRVHLAEIGSPVIGDLSYGNTINLPKELERRANEFGRQALHAYSLEFKHPTTDERMSFQSDLPDDFSKLIEFFKNYE